MNLADDFSDFDLAYLVAPLPLVSNTFRSFKGIALPTL